MKNNIVTEQEIKQKIETTELVVFVDENAAYLVF